MGFVILSNEEGFSGYGVRKCFRKWKRSGVKLYILQDTCRFIVNFFSSFLSSSRNRTLDFYFIDCEMNGYSFDSYRKKLTCIKFFFLFSLVRYIRKIY